MNGKEVGFLFVICMNESQVSLWKCQIKGHKYDNFKVAFSDLCQLEHCECKWDSPHYSSLFFNFAIN